MSSPLYERIEARVTPRTQTWSLWVPLEKSLAASSTRARPIQGLASSDNRDQQGERILRKGMDYSPLLAHGYLNWDHQKGPENLVGEPEAAEPTNTSRKGPGLFIKGFLYENHDRADAIWQILENQERNRAAGSPGRDLGMSVEGGIVARDPRDQTTVIKSFVRQMAITHQPVNADSYAEIAKSWGQTWTQDTDFSPESNVHHAFTSLDGLVGLLDPSLQKAMTSGPGLGGGDAQALMGGGKKLLGLFGQGCDGHCGLEKSGRRRALRHLSECLGMDPEEGFAVVKSLASQLLQ